MKKIHRVTQGDTFFIKIPLLIDGVETAVAGWLFWLTVKQALTDADAAAVLQLSTDGGTIVTHDATSVRAEGVPANTKDKTAARYEYDIQAKSPGGEIFTLEDGYFYIDPEKTISS